MNELAVALGLAVVMGLPIVAFVAAAAARRSEASGKLGSSPTGFTGPDVDAFAKATRDLGLRAVTPTFLQGVRAGRDVILGTSAGIRSDGRPFQGADIRVMLPPSAQRLTLRREGPFGGGGDVTTGDERFDARLDLGPERHVPLALFRADVRTALRSWSDRGLVLSSGWMSIWTDQGFTAAVRMLDELVALANALDVTDEPAALASMATTDPVPGVRVRALERLGDAHRSAAATRSSARTALQDRDAAVRAKAIEVLHATGAEHDVRESLDALLSDPDDTVRRKALAFVEPPVAGERFDLVLACADSGRPTVQAAAAEALGRLADPRGEEMLVALLDSDSADTKAAAARALGVVGTLRAVEPLLAQAGRFTNAGEVKGVARDAVRRIQERASGADAGRLSIAEAATEAGALSLATEGGALSVVPGTRDRERA